MPTETFSLKYDELKVSEDSLRLAMGYSQTPSPADDVVEEAIKHGRELFDIKGGFRIFDTISLDKSHLSILVDETSLSIHNIIFQQLKQATRVAIFACTAGREITEKSKALMKAGDMLGGYVYDTFGSIVVEEAMDIVQNALRNEMKSLGLEITNRYSPGYCGWSVAEQPRLFQLLPEHFCGIELTDSCLMVPTKSVSGIIGIGQSVRYRQYGCNLCDMKNCLYRNLKRKTQDKLQKS